MDYKYAIEVYYTHYTNPPHCLLFRAYADTITEALTIALGGWNGTAYITGYDIISSN